MAPKMANSCKAEEDLGQSVAGSKLNPSKDLFTVESPFKSTLPLAISIQNVISCVRLICWIYI